MREDRRLVYTYPFVLVLLWRGFVVGMKLFAFLAILALLGDLILFLLGFSRW